MRIKICGITKIEQGTQIAQLGATALGFICYPKSPRYVNSNQIENIIREIPPQVGKIGVFVNERVENIEKIVQETNLTGVQLHGDETVEYCHKIRQLLPQVEIIKALRIKNMDSLTLLKTYYYEVDTLLLDAYHPQLLGGTGHILDWEILQKFKPPLPWLLAGGLTSQNIQEALNQLSPDGIDLSSGVEIAPGNKDLTKVKQLFENLNINCD